MYEGVVDQRPGWTASPAVQVMVDAMAGRILAAGVLVGTYSRGEEAPVGRAGAMRAAPA